MPRASTVRAPAGALSWPRLVMTPSAMYTSTSRGPSGVWTVPPAITSESGWVESVKLEVGDAEKWRVRNARASNVVLTTLAAIEDHDEMNHVDARVAQHPRRAQRVAAGGDNVFDHRDPFARFEPTFDLLRGAVALRLFADEDQRQARLHRDRAPQEHGAKLGCREALRLSWHQPGELLAQPAQKGWIGFEQELVEVTVRAFSRPKDEIAFEVRGGDEVARQ